MNATTLPILDLARYADPADRFPTRRSSTTSKKLIPASI